MIPTLIFLLVLNYRAEVIIDPVHATNTGAAASSYWKACPLKSYTLPVYSLSDLREDLAIYIEASFGTLSRISSSGVTFSALAILTNSSKLTLFVPVSIWLIVGIDTPTFSASLAWVSFAFSVLCELADLKGNNPHNLSSRSYPPHKNLLNDLTLL